MKNESKVKLSKLFVNRIDRSIPLNPAFTYFLTEIKDMTVNVRHKNGIRYGSFTICGIKGRFPLHAITSTNLNHAKNMDVPNFDFKTNFLEIIEKFPLRIIDDLEYRKYRVKTISQFIQQNPDKICLLALNGIRSSVRMNKARNLSIMQFQIDCGFKLIRAFFSKPRNALKNLKEYRNQTPKDRSLVVVLDENLDNFTFKALYFTAFRHKDELISFYGREPRKNNDDNRLNFQFIARRKDDKIIKVVSMVKKSFDGVVGSLVYHLFGFDVYSFLTRFGKPNIPITDLKALNGFKYESLTENSGLVCVVTRTNLFNSSEKFAKDNRSSTPISVHDIVRLNEMFEVLHEKYTRKNLVLIVGDKIF